MTNLPSWTARVSYHASREDHVHVVLYVKGRQRRALILPVMVPFLFVFLTC